MNLAQLRDVVGGDEEELLRLASHLVQWNKARVGSVVTRRTRFCVAPGVSFRRDGPVSRAFRAAFPGTHYSLAEMLEPLAATPPLGLSLGTDPDDAAETIQMICWLYAQGIIRPIHRRLLFLAPPLPTDADTEEEEESTEDLRDNPWEGSEGTLSAHERHFLDTVVRPVSEEALFSVLERAAPWLRGRATDEEVMWRTRLTRTDLDVLAGVYGEFIVELETEEEEEDVVADSRATASESMRIAQDE